MLLHTPHRRASCNRLLGLAHNGITRQLNVPDIINGEYVDATKLRSSYYKNPIADTTTTT